LGRIDDSVGGTGIALGTEEGPWRRVAKNQISN
jgi:hypothetical protein